MTTDHADALSWASVTAHFIGRIFIAFRVCLSPLVVKISQLFLSLSVLLSCQSYESYILSDDLAERAQLITPLSAWKVLHSVIYAATLCLSRTFIQTSCIITNVTPGQLIYSLRHYYTLYVLSHTNLGTLYLSQMLSQIFLCVGVHFFNWQIYKHITNDWV